MQGGTDAGGGRGCRRSYSMRPVPVQERRKARTRRRSASPASLEEPPDSRLPPLLRENPRVPVGAAEAATPRAPISPQA